MINSFRVLASEIAERDFSHVTEETTIASLGIDSLGMLELVGSIEREFGARVPDEAFAGVTTVRQLLDVVTAHVEA